MTEHPPQPPTPAAPSKPPWKSVPLVLGVLAAAFAFAVAALESIRWATDWPLWSHPAVLAVLSAVAWTASRMARSDRWATVWDCCLFAWLSGALIVGGHLLLPLSDGLLEDAVVTWGSLALLLLWRRTQVRRGRRTSMDAPIRHRLEQTAA
jgi:hypothetical protein